MKNINQIKRNGLLIAGGLLCMQLAAQSQPKWIEKARKSVFSVVTYKGNQVLNNGNGFYIGEDGTAVADYTLFKGADRAVVISADGKELPVSWILGANEMYDVVKFKVNTKKAPALSLQPRGTQTGGIVYLLPYATQKSVTATNGKVAKIDSIANNAYYYTLDMATTDKQISCPIMNAEGQVVGILQPNADVQKEKSYALGIAYAQALNINALSINDQALKQIHIPTPLPEEVGQAQAYLFLAASQLSVSDYHNLVERFITQFPNNPEGYLQRATAIIREQKTSKYEMADKDLKQSIDVATNKADATYNVARILYDYLVSLPQGEQPWGTWTFDHALKLVNDALASTPNTLFMQLKGDLLFAKADYAEAATAYHAIQAAGKATPATYYAEAKAKQLAGNDKNEVIALLDSAIANYVKPYGKEAAPYLYERATVKADLNRFREAVSDLTDFYAAMMGQVSAEFFWIRSQNEMQCKMYKQAIDDINKAVEMEPQHADYWTDKGGIHLRLNQVKEAVEALQKAITIDPKQASAYRMLGYIKIQQKENKEGLELLHKALELGDSVAQGLIDKYQK